MENLGYDHPLGNEMLRKTIAKDMFSNINKLKQIQALFLLRQSTTGA